MKHLFLCTLFFGLSAVCQLSLAQSPPGAASQIGSMKGPPALPPDLPCKDKITETQKYSDFKDFMKPKGKPDPAGPFSDGQIKKMCDKVTAFVKKHVVKKEKKSEACHCKPEDKKAEQTAVLDKSQLNNVKDVLTVQAEAVPSSQGAFRDDTHRPPAFDKSKASDDEADDDRPKMKRHKKSRDDDDGDDDDDDGDPAKGRMARREQNQDQGQSGNQFSSLFGGAVNFGAGTRHFTDLAMGQNFDPFLLGIPGFGMEFGNGPVVSQAFMPPAPPPGISPVAGAPAPLLAQNFQGPFVTNTAAGTVSSPGTLLNGSTGITSALFQRR